MSSWIQRMPPNLPERFSKLRRETVQILQGKTRFSRNPNNSQTVQIIGFHSQTVQFRISAALPSHECTFKALRELWRDYCFAQRTARYQSSHTYHCGRWPRSPHSCFQGFPNHPNLYSLGILYSLASIFMLTQNFEKINSHHQIFYANRMFMWMRWLSSRQCQCHTRENLATWCAMLGKITSSELYSLAWFCTDWSFCGLAS